MSPDVYISWVPYLNFCQRCYSFVKYFKFVGVVVDCNVPEDLIVL